MGKRIVIQDVDFSENSLYFGGTYEYIENNFTWGKGGINEPGISSGNTNSSMSTIGLPLPQANEKLVYVGGNGYKIESVLTSDVASPTTLPVPNYDYVEYETPVSSVVIPSGKYYEIAVYRMDGQNANLSDGPTALLLKRYIE